MIIPPGFTTVTPYLFAKKADGLIEFLVNAFEAKELQRTLRPDYSVANALLKIGDSMIMITEAREDYPPMPASFFIYVASADYTMAKAVKAGATVEMDVTDTPHEDRQGGIRDPFGNIWWISQRLADKPYIGHLYRVKRDSG